MGLAGSGAEVRMRALSWWVTLVWGLAFTLLILDIVLALFNVSALRRTDTLVAEAREIKTEAARLAVNLADAETAVRGFVITGRPEFLNPHRAGADQIDRRLDRLRALTAGSPETVERVAVLDARVREKLEVMQQMIDARRRPGGAALAEAMVAAGVGQDAMDRVRAALADVDRDADALLADRARAADAAYRSTGYATLVGGGLTLGMAAMAFALARRELAGRKRAEQTLRASEARFRTLTEAIPQMVWNADAAGRVTYFNRRWTEYTGLTAAAAVESWWTQVTHPDDAPQMDDAWRQAVAGKPAPFEQEVRIRQAADGAYHWFLTAVIPLVRPDGLVDQWIGSLSSIDAQKQQSEILATLVRMRTAELESANQLLREEIVERTRAEGRAQAAAVELGRSNEDLEKFAYVASHDLQEPLRKIQAFGDRLAKRYRDALGPDGQEYVDRMKAAAARMRTLIDDLLAFSRVTTKAQGFHPVDLSAVARDVVSDLDASIAQNDGTVDVGPLPTVGADPTQMRQLVQNLIGNALKFHRPGVPPVVTVRAVPWVSLPLDSDPLRPPGDGYRITVADNGIGFDPAYAERVFEVFQRLHGRGEYEGTGIGLAICRKIVQRHGGTIVAHGRPGEGATFIIDLPAAAG
jgi:PAS domain S-box-containing protein